MAVIYEEPSRTFGEYLLIPSLTTHECTPDNVQLTTPLVRFKTSEEPRLRLNAPIVSAAMQAVSNHSLAIALARAGGLSFVYCSQPIEEQAEMVRKVKLYKAGFVVSDSNLAPTATLGDAVELTERTGHSTIPITEDGTATGKLVGLLTSRDYRLDKHSLGTVVAELMTPFSALHHGIEGLNLEEANDLIWQHKLSCLPVVSTEGRLVNLVFRRDYEEHKAHPYEVVDGEKRLLVGAAINTRDYRERVPALLQAGADVLCIDSSDGYSAWQKDTLDYVKKEFGEHTYVGAGNVVDGDAFEYLAGGGADFVKVGIGGGSICITREQKGIGRGQATAVIEVAKARDAYAKRTGTYVPLCSDGGITNEYHIALAIAMGADFVMMGRYFARFDEAPGRRLLIQNAFVKEYWGEGANRARNWQRYDLGSPGTFTFEEGVDSYVQYAGKLADNLGVTTSKIRSTMCSCGARNIQEFQKRARLTLASAISIHEGGAHDVILKDKESGFAGPT